MKIQLQINNPRPWRINLAPPRDRIIEIAHKGETVLAIYSEKDDAWATSTLEDVPESKITRWREDSKRASKKQPAEPNKNHSA